MKNILSLSVALLSIVLLQSATNAGCSSCNRSPCCEYGPGMPVVPYHGLGSVVAYGHFFGASEPTMRVHAPHPNQLDGKRYPVLPGGGNAAGNGLVPFVPGTLGQTYTKTSHPLPDEKHPRAAMLAVRDHGSVSHMSVHGMSGFRMENGIWLFETDRPLVPWVESIVRVEARNEAQDIEPHRISFVRLIAGRIVYLDFQ